MQPQQSANNTQWLMKRRSNGISLRPHFSFRIRLLGSTLLLRDCLERILQYIKLLYVNFNSSTLFYPSTSPPGKVTVGNTAARRSVGRTSILPTDRGKPSLLAKKERHPKAADTAAGFWGTKSHSSLGRFLHAPFRSC